MKGRFSTGAALLVLLVFAAGCSADGEAKHGNASGAGKPPVPVDAARTFLGDVEEGIDVVGTLSPRFQAEIKSDYGGIVSRIHVSDWARVKKGDPLLTVDTREGEVLLQKVRAALEMAKAGLLEAEAAGKRADREYERASSLLEAGLVTRQAMDDAQTQKEAAAARISAAGAQVTAAREDVAQVSTRLGKAVIRAPFDGIVSERLVNVGDLVGEMQKFLFRVVDNRMLELTATVPSMAMASLRTGMPLRFSTDAVPGREFRGKVTFINPSVSPGDRSVRVIAEVPNVPEVLKGGLFVKGRIVTGSRKGVVLVPREALQAWDAAVRKGEVYVVDNNVARRRDVATGESREEAVEISSGLKAGETVVTRGAFNVKDGDALKVAGARGN
jgi:membrane fusion protein (multidrug efflux system)